jgi:hypothetical protein
MREGEDTLSMLGRNLCGIGDVNGDGFDDVAFSSDQPLGTYIYYGGNPADTIPDYFLRGGGSMGAGIDMTGDGIPDLVVQSPTDRVLLYRGFGDSLESVPSDSISPASDIYSYGYSVVLGYASGDGIGDLALIDYGYTGGGRAYYYRNPFSADDDKEPDWTYTNHNLSHSMGSVDFMDFNGDGCLDIVMSHQADLDSISAVYIFDGPDFDTIPSVVIGAPSELDTLGYPNGRETFGYLARNIGDFNGDVWDDLAIIYQYRPVLYFGGPGSDTLWDLLPEAGSWSPARAGDVNGDGWNDYVCGVSRTWWGALDVFLGGPRADSVSDYTVFDDNFDPYPRHSIETVGRWVAPAGDFDNDGYDDLLVANKNMEGRDYEYGSVYVLAGGPQIVVGVDEGGQSLLPDTYSLSQNCPNPFNPITIIRYVLAKHSHVEMTVCNVLGQRVVTLVDEDKPAGEHSVSWDATGFASGVYFYRLRAREYVQTKKMLLLK